MVLRVSLFFLLLMGLATPSIAQIEEPVKWTFAHEKIGEGEYLLKCTATMNDGWYIYAQDNPNPDGPVPTSFEWKQRKSYQYLSDVEEVGSLIDKYDKFFETQVKKYSGEVTFQRKVRTTKAVDRIRGELEYMCCNDEKCLPPTPVKFSFTVGKDDEAAVAGATKKPASNSADGLTAQKIEDPVKWSYDWVELLDGTFELRIKAAIENGWYVYSQDNNPDEGPKPTLFSFDESADIEWLDEEVIEEGKLKAGIDPVFNVHVNKYAHNLIFKRKVKLLNPDAVISGDFEFMTCDDGKCLFPPPVSFEFNKDGYIEQDLSEIETMEIDVVKAITDCGEGEPADSTEGMGLLMIFLLGALGGLGALITPCVFPMIPLTVSFFTKQSGTRAKGIRNAIIYALSIIVIYVGLGYFVTVVFGADALNALSTNVWFNLAFFVLFVVFAISFFGYFEITLPSWLINKSDAASERGGLIGIFFMAFTLALVSFSCTGPIIGTLLVEAAVNGEQAGPLMGMLGFSVALALPFALFALFPSWLNSLPRSGGWMNSVKVILGFIELIFALKFLSNADLVSQWGLLKREVFLVIWIVLLSGMAAYLFGMIKFPHDSPIKKLSFPRIGLGILTILSALYLIPGLMCKSLPLVAGFPPPTFYSYGCGAEELHDENQFHGIQDLEQGLTLAVQTDKPILLDFTGWACVNCRRMEENVWPEVAELIDEYTLVSLYVDEKTDLPDDDQVWVEVNGNKRQLLTVGNQWSYLQTKCFMTNTQPYYALMTPEGRLLEEPRGYTPDVPTYEDWLQKGLSKYQSKGI